MDDNEKELLAWREHGGLPFFAFNYDKYSSFKKVNSDFLLKEDFR